MFDHILIGGSGFIAAHLREACSGSNVLLIDRKKPKEIRQNETFLCHDVRQGLRIKDSFIHSDTVVHHLAAVHFDFQKDFYETNVEGTKNVIAAFCACRHWVFYSSVAVYGDSSSVRDESSELLATSDYGKSKLLMELAIHESIESADLGGKIAIVRPGVVYGEWNFGNVFNLMWLSSRFLPIGLNSNPIKSMAYVQNLVSSTLFALEKADSNEPLIYNYVDYKQLGTKDLLALIAKTKAKQPIFISFGLILAISHFLTPLFKIAGKDFLASPMRVKKLAQPTHFLADKIRTLGFMQPFTPDDAVKRTIDWISSNDIKALRSDWRAGFTKSQHL